MYAKKSWENQINETSYWKKNQKQKTRKRWAIISFSDFSLKWFKYATITDLVKPQGKKKRRPIWFKFIPLAMGCHIPISHSVIRCVSAYGIESVHSKILNTTNRIESTDIDMNSDKILDFDDWVLLIFFFWNMKVINENTVQCPQLEWTHSKFSEPHKWWRDECKQIRIASNEIVFGFEKCEQTKCEKSSSSSTLSHHQIIRLTFSFSSCTYVHRVRISVALH